MNQDPMTISSVIEAFVKHISGLRLLLDLRTLSKEWKRSVDLALRANNYIQLSFTSQNLDERHMKLQKFLEVFTEQSLIPVSRLELFMCVDLFSVPEFEIVCGRFSHILRSLEIKLSHAFIRSGNLWTLLSRFPFLENLKLAFHYAEQFYYGVDGFEPPEGFSMTNLKRLNYFSSWQNFPESRIMASLLTSTPDDCTFTFTVKGEIILGLRAFLLTDLPEMSKIKNIQLLEHRSLFLSRHAFILRKNNLALVQLDASTCSLGFPEVLQFAEFLKSQSETLKELYCPRIVGNYMERVTLPTLKKLTKLKFNSSWSCLKVYCWSADFPELVHLDMCGMGFCHLTFFDIFSRMSFETPHKKLKIFITPEYICGLGFIQSLGKIFPAVVDLKIVEPSFSALEGLWPVWPKLESLCITYREDHINSAVLGRQSNLPRNQRRVIPCLEILLSNQDRRLDYFDSLDSVHGIFVCDANGQETMGRSDMSLQDLEYLKRLRIEGRVNEDTAMTVVIKLINLTDLSFKYTTFSKSAEAKLRKALPKLMYFPSTANYNWRRRFSVSS